MDERRIEITTADGAGYRFEIAGDRRLHQTGFGANPPWSEGLPIGVFPLAYPTWGEGLTRMPALRVTHHGGDPTTRLTVIDQDRSALPDATGHEHAIRLHDEARGLQVSLGFRTWDAVGVIEQWVEVHNGEAGPITVHELAAAAPAWWGTDAWLTHHGGGWAEEWQTHEQRLLPGTKLLESFGGVRPHLQLNPFFLLSLGEPSTEHTGTVLAGALAWSGNVRLAFELGNPMGQLRALCGWSSVGAEVVIDPGESITSPRMVWAWSAEGRASLTHRVHRWVRANVVRDGDRPRAVVMNNWEATFFGFDQQKLVAMMDDAVDLGAELFLLDDGWFGERHPRDADDAGLGDWTVDRRKLPGGIEALTSAAEERGIRFGLWVEPEMVNPRSELYEAHPDWVVHIPDRDRRQERQQLVLDLCRPEVQDYVTGTIDRLLGEHPGISYLKWDANRDVSEPGSPALAADRQTNYWVELERATTRVMRDIARSRPDVELMLCASGGGRVDLQSLRWFHEVWTSDNTDPVDRVLMQWAASHYLPPKVLGAHVTRWGERPVEFGCAVAMSARFGFDLDTSGLSEHERSVCRTAVEVYLAHRDLVQEGDLHRLVSPWREGAVTSRDGEAARTGSAALSYSSPDRRRSILFAFQLDEPGFATPAVVPLAGLDPDRAYDVRRVEAGGEDGLATATGAALLERGLDWPLTAPVTAAIWSVSATG
jgi:alpha-galactosidase